MTARNRRTSPRRKRATAVIMTASCVVVLKVIALSDHDHSRLFTRACQRTHLDQNQEYCYRFRGTWRGTQEAEGGRLLISYGCQSPRGFESLPLRQDNFLSADPST